MLSALLLLVQSQGPNQAADQWRDNWIALATERLERQSRAELTSTEPLEARQSRWRVRFLESMGLHPLPEKTPLNPAITGKIEKELFTVEKIHFQSRPGLYVTGNLYLPKNGNAPFPTILYVCGHATLVREEPGPDGKPLKVAYGSKIPYQHHPALFAASGYACLILDTLQLGEIEGTHHGTYRFNRWWWHDRGYTPAGVELWNAIRALDYLESRRQVDKSRLAVTGRSGGGATSWWLAAADTRVKAAVPVAGLSDLRGHLLQGEMEPNIPGCITGHCDCMYFHNVGQLDFAQVISLCAPRAVLLGNSDKDAIFPVGGYRRPPSLARLAYSQAGKPDSLALMETAGGHVDTPELRQGAMGWMDRHAAGTQVHDLQNRKPEALEPRSLKVFDKIPADEQNTRVDEWFVPRANHAIPESAKAAAQWLQTEPERIRGELLRTTFAHWPKEHCPVPRLVSSSTREGRLVQVWSLEVEPGLEIPFSVNCPANPVSGQPAKVRVTVGPPPIAEGGGIVARKVPSANEVEVAFNPRGTGSLQWSDTHPGPDGKPKPHMTRRRLALLGATVESGQVWDILQLLQALAMIPQTSNQEIHLTAPGPMGVNALYASIFSKPLEGLKLEKIPLSHLDGPHYLHVLRWLDIPQAIACSKAREIRLTPGADPEKSPGWEWLGKMSSLSGEKARWKVGATLGAP